MNKSLKYIKKVLFEAPFEERTSYGMVNIRQKLILFGGRNPKTGKYLNDVWMSQY
ncbi:MAG: Kelch repeat-containing protein [Brevinemataceae bacterium]